MTVRVKTEREESNMENKSLNEWAAEIHEYAVSHGWYEEGLRFGEVVANCHGELSEALEEYRDRHPLVYCDAIETNASCSPKCDGMDCLKEFPGRKPEGIAVEMIDCIIRILDWCANAGVDVDALLAAKHEYNKTRPYRHGNKAM